MQISIWEKESFLAPRDVVIIGSGLMGLWSAFFLMKKNPQLRVTVVERGILPTGASTRNAGFACFGSLTELMADREKMGEDKMLQLVTMRYRGLKKIQEVFSKKEIGFDLCGGYELITEKDGLSKGDLTAQASLLNKLLKEAIGEKDIFKMADKKISRFGFEQVSHLLENKKEGYLHSGSLCKALFRKIQSMGVLVLNGIEIKAIERTGADITLVTNYPFQMKAGKVLICTNAFATQLLPELDVVPARGQVLLTAPIKDLPFKGTFHYEEGFYYFRNLGDRVLLGGARNKAFEEEQTTVMDTTDKIQKELEDFLSDHILPGKAYEITDRWSGIMAMGGEKMPIIKEVSPNVFCAVRMHGMGVALSPVAAQKVTTMML